MATLVSKQFCTIKRSWRHEERCTAILFGSTLVMAVYASDAVRTWNCMRLVSPASLGSSVRSAEGVQKSFYITGDFIEELEMICAGRNHIEELNEMCKLLCFKGMTTILAVTKKSCGTAS